MLLKKAFAALPRLRELETPNNQYLEIIQEILEVLLFESLCELALNLDFDLGEKHEPQDV